MDNTLTRILYDRSPAFVKNMLASAYGYSKNRNRFGGVYQRWYDLFDQGLRSSTPQLEEYQSVRLREHVSDAYLRTAFYRRLYDEHGVDVTQIQTISDLDKLPIISKDQIRECTDELLVTAPDEPIYWKPTSGSTGTPMRIPWSSSSEQMEWGFVWARARAEVERSSSYSSFTGLELYEGGRSKPPFWVDNWANKQRMFSIFHMNDANMPSYIDALESGYNDYLSGYASAVYSLANYILDQGIEIRNRPAYFYNGSEVFQSDHRVAIEEAFGCRCRDHYGQVELCGSITEYHCGHLHYDMDYSILEFDEVETYENGEVLAEVIATNINNAHWKLIRYRTGDLVVYHPDDRCSECPGQVIRRIQGRTGGYFVLKDGSRVTNISVIAKKCSNVRFMQVVQDDPGVITVRVVRADGYRQTDEDTLLDQFRKKIGDETSIEIDYVDDIERTKAGKYLSIINRIGS